MKITSLKNFELKDRCPECSSWSQFKRYVNAGQCNAHPLKEICYFTDSNKIINKVEIIEGTNSIVFDLVNEKLILHLENEDDINLPLFDMDIHTVSVKSIKKLLVFK